MSGPNDIFESVTGLRLEDPWGLLLVLPLFAIVLLARRRQSASIRFAPPVGELPPSWRVRTRRLPGGLEVAALALLVVALARPVDRSPLPLETQGIDIVLAIDTSSSMKAVDMDPTRTRLEVAKSAAERFISRRPDDRIGLIRFARYPDVLAPATRDHVALGALLDEIERVAEDGPEDATAIGAAIAAGARALRGAGSGASGKVLILLTDGEENVATAEAPHEIGPRPAAQLCEAFGVRVYSVVAGRGRPGPRGQFEPLDLTQIQEVADRTGGALMEARDAAGMDAVYETIDRLEKVSHAEPRFEIEDRFLGVLFLGLALWLVGRALRATVWEVLP